MEVTGKDILNLVCAVKIVETTTRNGYYVFNSNMRDTIDCALQETIDKYRNQLKDNQMED